MQVIYYNLSEPYVQRHHEREPCEQAEGGPPRAEPGFRDDLFRHDEDHRSGGERESVREYGLYQKDQYGAGHDRQRLDDAR